MLLPRLRRLKKRRRMKGGHGTRVSGNFIVVLASALEAAYSCLRLDCGEAGLRRIAAGLRFEKEFCGHIVCTDEYNVYTLSHTSEGVLTLTLAPTRRLLHQPFALCSVGQDKVRAGEGTNTMYTDR